jgi:flagellar hook-basal body complex protein FliE
MNPLAAISSLPQMQGLLADPTSIPGLGNLPLNGGQVPTLQQLSSIPGLQQLTATSQPGSVSNISQLLQSPNSIEGFGGINALPTAASASNAGTFASPTTWGQLVQKMVLDVNDKQQTASQKVLDVLDGGPTPVHDALAATEEASLSFTFLGEMRNKVVEAYTQIMQMQV